MVDFTCLLDWAMACPDIWLNIILDVSWSLLPAYKPGSNFKYCLSQDSQLITTTVIVVTPTNIYWVFAMYIVSAFTSHLILTTRLWNEEIDVSQIEEVDFSKLVAWLESNQIYLSSNFGLLTVIYFHVAVLFLCVFYKTLLIFCWTSPWFGQTFGYWCSL